MNTNYINRFQRDGMATETKSPLQAQGYEQILEIIELECRGFDYDPGQVLMDIEDICLRSLAKINQEKKLNSDKNDETSVASKAK